MDYLASYDLESVDRCVKGARAVAEVHRRRGLPATFFVVGRCIQKHGDELRGILDDELFDIQNHTLSHALLRDSGCHGAGVASEEAHNQILEGARMVKECFGRECKGMRTPCGFTDGLLGKPDLLQACADAGCEYVSSAARGPGDSLPAPFKHPYTYKEDGFAALWELPVHGWHDNVLKGFAPNISFITFPMPDAWQIRQEPTQTPQEDAEHHLLWVEKAMETDMPFISFAFHPWSLIRFDPQVRELDIIFDGLEEREIEVVTASTVAEKLRSAS